jgi:hypothetical protein
MIEITPVACSLRVAASPLQGATPCAPAKPVARCFWVGAVSALCLAVAACSSNPPLPQWPAEARGSSERATEAWLGGNSRIEAAEFNRARAELASTGQVALVARLELLRCATRVASLVVEPCAGFEALAQDTAPAEKAYARYLAGAAQAGDAALLPEVHRALLGNASPETALASIQDPLSRLVAAGVLFRSGRATPGVIATAVDTASARGWRRPLLAWLKVQQQRAQTAGDTMTAAALQRRIDLVAPPR